MSFLQTSSRPACPSAPPMHSWSRPSCVPRCTSSAHKGFSRRYRLDRWGWPRPWRRSVDDRPAWARRMYNERLARGWSQADAVKAMRAHYSHEHSTKGLPDSASLLRQYKRWEAGEVEPDRGKAEPFYKPII